MYLFYISVRLPCLHLQDASKIPCKLPSRYPSHMLPSVCPLPPFACVPSLVTCVTTLEYLTLLAYTLKLSYCSLLARPAILLTDNYKAYPVISRAFVFLIVKIYILSCEFIKVHIFRVTRVLLFIIIFSTSHRIIFISSCASM